MGSWVQSWSSYHDKKFSGRMAKYGIRSNVMFRGPFSNQRRRQIITEILLKNLTCQKKPPENVKTIKN